jgi:hypothetical protein
MTSVARSVTLGPRVTANPLDPRVIGYEILRKLDPSELPDRSLNLRTQRAVLGAGGQRYLVPPGVDIFELGLIDTAGHFELLPIDVNDKPLWDETVHLLVTDEQAQRQRELLMRSYETLRTMIQEVDALEASITEWSSRGVAHPVFGMLRLETIEVWKAMRNGLEPLSYRELETLQTSVARRVAAKIGAHVIH